LKFRLHARRCAATLLLVVATAVQAQQDAVNLAPGFTALPKHAKVVIAPLDVELFSLSAGGQPEPRADWTDAAKRHIKAALHERARSMELAWSEMDDQTAAEHVELMHLHDLVADAISMHSAASTRLPTKDGKLEWSFGDAMRPLQAATGARYGLFVYLRDSYATTERKAMIGVVALLSAATSGGASLLMLNAGLQDGEATLIDLETGEVLWFNELRSRLGDVREAAAAADTVKALLAGFPEVK
jgi:hypothetical protein